MLNGDGERDTGSGFRGKIGFRFPGVGLVRLVRLVGWDEAGAGGIWHGAQGALFKEMVQMLNSGWAN